MSGPEVSLGGSMAGPGGSYRRRRWIIAQDLITDGGSPKGQRAPDIAKAKHHQTPPAYLRGRRDPGFKQTETHDFMIV